MKYDDEYYPQGAFRSREEFDQQIVDGSVFFSVRPAIGVTPPRMEQLIRVTERAALTYPFVEKPFQSPACYPAARSSERGFIISYRSYTDDNIVRNNYNRYFVFAAYNMALRYYQDQCDLHRRFQRGF